LLFPSAATIAEADISSIGLPRTRAESIRCLARAVACGELRFTAGSEEVLERLRSIPGIGSWTTQYIAMRALSDPDAFPDCDLGLIRALRLDDAKQLAGH